MDIYIYYTTRIMGTHCTTSMTRDMKLKKKRKNIRELYTARERERELSNFVYSYSVSWLRLS